MKDETTTEAQRRQAPDPKPATLTMIPGGILKLAAFGAAVMGAGGFPPLAPIPRYQLPAKTQPAAIGDGGSNPECGSETASLPQPAPAATRQSTAGSTSSPQADRLCETELAYLRAMRRHTSQSPLGPFVPQPEDAPETEPAGWPGQPTPQAIGGTQPSSSANTAPATVADNSGGAR